jgi:hypothetical protein
MLIFGMGCSPKVTVTRNGWPTFRGMTSEISQGLNVVFQLMNHRKKIGFNYNR